MSSRLVVDSQNQLKELGAKEIPKYPPFLRIPAIFLSYIFHPVLVPVYVVIFLVYVHPYLFAGFAEWDKARTVIMAGMMFFFFPVVTVLLLKALKFIDSIRLLTRKDRIIPLIACFTLCYFWVWYVWNNLPDYPHEAVRFAFAVFLAGVLGFLANIYIKVSLHAISMGVMVAFIMGLAFDQSLSFGLYISISLLIAGLVCTARLLVSDHSQTEIYLGFFLGVLAQLLANWFA
jgi:hypothetical protein